MSPPYFRDTVSVGITSTSLAVVNIANTRLMAVSVYNPDATHSVSVTLRRRAHVDDQFSEGAVLEELITVPPLTPKSADVDCGTHYELEVVGVALSGPGHDIFLACKPDMGRRP